MGLVISIDEFLPVSIAVFQNAICRIGHRYFRGHATAQMTGNTAGRFMGVEIPFFFDYHTFFTSIFEPFHFIPLNCPPP